VTNVTHPGASPDERCDEDAIQAERVARAGRPGEDLLAVRVHERGGQEPVGPVDRDPALDASGGGHGSGVGDESRRRGADGRSRERGPRLAVGGLDREAIEVYVDAPSNAS